VLSFTREIARKRGHWFLVICCLSLVLLLAGCAIIGGGRLETELARVRWQVREVTAERAGVGTPSPLLAGAARVLLDVPSGVPLAGYGARRGHRSLGVHDPLYARACALSDGSDTVVIVSVDLVAVTDDLFEAVWRKVTRQLPQLGREDMLLCATHTHSGVGGIGHRWLERVASGHLDRQLFERVTERIAEAVVEAVGGMAPAELAFGETELSGLAANRMEADGLVDTRLRAVKVSRVADGALIALCVRWSAHATLLGSGNQLLSGDWPGALAQRVETAHPGAVAPVFIGAVGDQRPVRAPGVEEPFERVAWYAERLFEAVGCVAWSEPVATADVRAAQVRLDLPSPRLRMTGLRWLGPLGHGLVRRKTSVSVARVGDWTLVGVPGEPTAEVGQSLETAALDGEGVTWPISLVNGYVGYVVSERQYRLDAYEARMSSYGPWLAEQMRQAAAGLWEALTPEVDPPLTVVVLEGAPYAMGRRHGEMEAGAISACVTELMGYFQAKVPLPIGRRWVMHCVLDTLWLMMRPHVPSRYLDEIRGVADGSGVPLRQLERLHALIEISATCSSFAVFGRATPDGRLIHGRNLEWNIRAGAQRYIRLFVHRPEGRHAFVSVGFTGFIGTLSGINERGVSIGQIGALSADQSFRGTPMPMLLRRVLEESGTLEEAVRIMELGPRTRGFNYVFGSSSERRAVVLETTHEHCVTFNDEEERASVVSYAIPLEDAVVRADTALDPMVRDRQWASRGRPRQPGLEPPDGSGAYEKRYKVQAELIRQHHGAIDVPTAIEIARAAAQRSSIQSVIYADPELWVATARGTARAADRMYHRYDLRELFRWPAEPSSEEADRRATNVREPDDRAVMAGGESDQLRLSQRAP